MCLFGSSENLPMSRTRLTFPAWINVMIHNLWRRYINELSAYLLKSNQSSGLNKQFSCSNDTQKIGSFVLLVHWHISVWVSGHTNHSVKYTLACMIRRNVQKRTNLFISNSNIKLKEHPVYIRGENTGSDCWLIDLGIKFLFAPCFVLWLQTYKNSHQPQFYFLFNHLGNVCMQTGLNKTLNMAHSLFHLLRSAC